MNITKTKIKKIEKLENFDDEYVYDVGIKGDTPYFFGNNILVHNSSYFSSYPMDLKNGTLNGITDLKQFYIDKYNEIGKQVNISFPPFMQKSFNVPISRGEVIKAARELVASKGLFITKKRYAVLIYDKENKRKDIDDSGEQLIDKKTGNPIYGEIKAMGLETKRSDTPPAIQDFLEEVILMVLTGKTQNDVLSYVSGFREQFRQWNGWEMGSPKKVNALTKFTRAIDYKNTKSMGVGKDNAVDEKNLRVPGHVTAAIAWNKLKKMYGDHYSMPIMDGSKVIVCKLKPNNLNEMSVAYPVDENHIPDWFKALPFDHDEMEATIIDKKLSNLIGVLKYDLQSTRKDTTFGDLFSF